MILNYYQKPETEVCSLNTRYPCMIPIYDGETSLILTNEHHWEDGYLDEEVDNDPYTHAAPSLWDE